MCVHVGTPYHTVPEAAFGHNYEHVRLYVYVNVHINTVMSTTANNCNDMSCNCSMSLNDVTECSLSTPCSQSACSCTPGHAQSQLFQAGLSCSAALLERCQGLPEPLQVSRPVMGNNICCSRRAPRASGHGSDELTGTPAPSAPRVDASGNRLTISPRSGRVVILPRTDPKELSQLELD